MLGAMSASAAAHPTPYGDLNRYSPAAIKYLFDTLLKKREGEDEAARFEKSLHGVPEEIAAIARVAQGSPEEARMLQADRAKREAAALEPQQRAQEAAAEEASLRTRMKVQQEFQDKVKQQGTAEAQQKYEMLMKALGRGGAPAGAPGVPGAMPPGAAAPGGPGGAAPGAPAGPEAIPDEMYEELQDTMSRIPGIDMSVLRGFVPQSQHDKQQQQQWSNRVKEQEAAKEQAQEQAAMQAVAGLGPEAVERAKIYGPKDTLKYYDDLEKEDRTRQEAAGIRAQGRGEVRDDGRRGAREGSGSRSSQGPARSS